jgi:hypothetical protein
MNKTAKGDTALTSLKAAARQEEANAAIAERLESN